MNCQHCTINTDITELRTILERIDKAVNGNGQPGLVQRVGRLEGWRSYADGALKVIGIVLGILVTAGGIVLAAKLKTP